MASPLRRHLFGGLVILIVGLGAVILAGGGRGTYGGAAACPGNVGVKAEGPACRAAGSVVLNAAEQADKAAGEKPEGGMCPACRKAGGMCERCAMCRQCTMCEQCSACERCKAMHHEAKLEELTTSIVAARTAVEAGEKEKALTELDKARELVGRLIAAGGPPASAKADGGKVVNATCPILGTMLDRDKVPEKRTRGFQGRTVGFCCGGCPAAWDRLSDQEKQARLEKAMPAE